MGKRRVLVSLFPKGDEDEAKNSYPFGDGIVKPVSVLYLFCIVAWSS